MLCLLIVWNLRNFKLIVKDNSGSGCYGYAIIVSRGVLRGFITLTHTFPGYV